MYAHVGVSASRRHPWHVVVSYKRWLFEHGKGYYFETKCGESMVVYTPDRTTPIEPKELRCRRCFQ